jgi:hypothetical protein
MTRLEASERVPAERAAAGVGAATAACGSVSGTLLDAASAIATGSAAAGWAPPALTAKMALHTAQRARTPPAGTFPGSTR